MLENSLVAEQLGASQGPTSMKLVGQLVSWSLLVNCAKY
jgi:hypothetical protein